MLVVGRFIDSKHFNVKQKNISNKNSLLIKI